MVSLSLNREHSYFAKESFSANPQPYLRLILDDTGVYRILAENPLTAHG